MTRYPTMTRQTYYYRYPRRPTMRQRSRGKASLILGAVAFFTSWLIVGAVFGVAAVATGVTARGRAAGVAKRPATARVGIAFGLVSIVFGVGVLAAMF
jgi:hypothetical protein